MSRRRQRTLSRRQRGRANHVEEASAAGGLVEDARVELPVDREQFGRGGGGNGVGGSRPLLDSARCGARVGVFRATSALCEARFELLYPAGLRGYFRVSWAVPRCESRATKQPKFLKSLVRWEFLR
jgi:hypothetical protein